MKKIFSLYVFIFLAFASQSFAQLPSLNFEDWNIFPESPKGWITSSLFAPTVKPVSKTSDSYKGNSAMKMQTVLFGPDNDTIPGTAITGNINSGSPVLGFPYSSRPTGVSFYYKYLPDTSGDIMNISVILTKYDTVTQEKKFIGFADFTNSVADTAYTKQDIAFVYDPNETDAPDSMLIVISNTDQSAPKLGSVLFIDDISFTGVSGLVTENAINNVKEINTYPNPAQHITNFSFQLDEPQKVSIQLFDILGKQSVAVINNESRPAGKNSVAYDVSGLAEGIYIYRINAGKESKTGKLIISR